MNSEGGCEPCDNMQMQTARFMPAHFMCIPFIEWPWCGRQQSIEHFWGEQKRVVTISGNGKASSAVMSSTACTRRITSIDRRP